jgi:hypothetical protein
MTLTLNEDALARAIVRGDEHLRVELLGNVDDGAWAARIIRDDAGFAHVRDSVFKECENVWAVVGTEPIAGTKVLVDPHSHVANPAAATTRTAETVPIRPFPEVVGGAQLLLRNVRDVS